MRTRLSCRRDDPGYRGWMHTSATLDGRNILFTPSVKVYGDAFARGIVLPGVPLFDGVTVDGKEVADVVTADELAGYVDVFDRAVDGNLKIDRVAEEVVTKRIYGFVQIRWTPAGELMLQAESSGVS